MSDEIGVVLLVAGLMVGSFLLHVFFVLNAEVEVLKEKVRALENGKKERAVHERPC